MPVHLSAVLDAEAHSPDDSFFVQSLPLTTLPCSPVLAVDDFRVSGQPFGPHPHAGFSAITYVFRDSPGRLRNRDSLGDEHIVGAGGLCWFESGSGALHEERPADDNTTLHGLQVFVNLSAAHKRTAPRTLAIDAADVPVWRSAAGDAVHVVVGNYLQLSSPLVPLEPFTLLDIALAHEVAFDLQRGHSAVVSVRRGTLVVRSGDSERTLRAGQGVVAFDGAGPVQLRALDHAEVMLLSGAALSDRVVAHGPFVMTNEAEINAAVHRFRAGAMGRLAPYAG